MGDTVVTTRLWEIDAARTAAMVLMVIYHVVYDIHLLAPGVAPNPYQGGWRALQVVTGSLFLGVVGVSFWVSHAQAARRGIAGMELWRSHLPRAAEVLAAAALVSLATFVVLGPEDVVRFGILHLIGVLMLLVLPLTVRLGPWNALLALGVVALGLSMDARSDVPGALMLGFIPPEQGVDWYPILPWAGAALFGIAVASVLYPGGRRGTLVGRLPAVSRVGHLAGEPGRHSLPFYLIHQPVLIAVIGATLMLGGIELQQL